VQGKLPLYTAILGKCKTQSADSERQVLISKTGFARVASDIKKEPECNKHAFCKENIFVMKTQFTHKTITLKVIKYSDRSQFKTCLSVDF
jgi:hypothetical protein